MADLPIHSLLKLQTSHLDYQQCQKQLNTLPNAISTQAAIIQAKEAAFEQWQASHRQFTSRQKTLETDIQSAEDKLQQLQTQTYHLQKSDAYHAMETEIAHLRKNIDEWEDQAIELLMAIDESQTKGEQLKTENDQAIAEARLCLKALQERQTQEEKKLAQKQTSYHAVRAETNPTLLEIYDRLSTSNIKAPIIVTMSEHQCCGCHLRVSREVEEKVIIGKEFAYCDQCHRLLYK